MKELVPQILKFGTQSTAIVTAVLATPFKTKEPAQKTSKKLKNNLIKAIVSEHLSYSMHKKPFTFH